MNFPGFSKAEGIYLNAFKPYLSKRERADMSLPIKIENREYRHLFSRMPNDPLYTKLMVLYNDGEIVTDADEVRRSISSVFGLTLYQEPESQLKLDIKQGDVALRKTEIDALTKLKEGSLTQFSASDQEAVSDHLEYFKSLEEVGKPLSIVAKKILDHKKLIESSDKVTEEQLLFGIDLAEERTQHRNELERLLFFNGEYTRQEVSKVFRKHKRSIRAVIGRNAYRKIVSEMKGAERETPRIIRETNKIYGTSLNNKKDFLNFLKNKPKDKERFQEQLEVIFDQAWVLSRNYNYK